MAARSQDRGADILIEYHAIQSMGSWAEHGQIKPQLQGVYKLFLICAVIQMVKNTLNPVWRPFRIPMQSLCGGDVEKRIKVHTHTYTWTVTHCD